MTSQIALDADKRSARALASLHPASIADAAEIQRLLASAHRAGTSLLRGLNKEIEPEIARIEKLDFSRMILSVKNFERDSREVLFLNFVDDADPYFFQTPIVEWLSDQKLVVGIPEVIYRSERRSRERRIPNTGYLVTLSRRGSYSLEARILDISEEGVGLRVSKEAARDLAVGNDLSIVTEGDLSSEHGVLRNCLPGPSSDWMRIGIELSPAPIGGLEHESIRDLRPKTVGSRAEQRIRIALGGAQVAIERAVRRFRAGIPQSEEPRIVDFLDPSGRPLRGILDSTGEIGGSTAIVIPPAWGRTKETLMPLVATIIQCFDRARLPVTVLRFDGINRRGESFREDGAGPAARDQKRFTFSQAVSDISAAVDHLHSAYGSEPSRTVLVSFSAASIEARRAVATDRRIDGWVSVVGSADLQSMMRTISGGIDYARGLERGESFGLQEILGVTVDMDLAGKDALENDLVYLGDSRSDMSKIDVPITWIHGKHDAWMDVERVRNALACGDTSQRKLVEVPTGHMLKSSIEALGVFQLVASEVSRIAIGKPVPRAVPNLVKLERKQAVERSRLPKIGESDLQEFWADYLLGRDRTIGIELMTDTSAYQQLMSHQFEALGLRDGHTVADLGSGTGAFPLFIKERGWRKNQVQVVEIDFIVAALHRARARLGTTGSVSFAGADLRCSAGASIPLRTGSVDSVLASLILSYVSSPSDVLREVFRVLRPGGRLVVSSLRPDADMSKLFVDGVSELKARWNDSLSRWAGGATFEDATRAYLNEASRLLDLEESGQFSFWDEEQLAKMLERSSFKVTDRVATFGDPPQAVVVTAIRPS